jgi:hypothetical protein
MSILGDVSLGRPIKWLPIGVFALVSVDLLPKHAPGHNGLNSNEAVRR